MRIDIANNTTELEKFFILRIEELNEKVEKLRIENGLKNE